MHCLRNPLMKNRDTRINKTKFFLWFDWHLVSEEMAIHQKVVQHALPHHKFLSTAIIQFPFCTDHSSFQTASQDRLAGGRRPLVAKIKNISYCKRGWLVAHNAAPSVCVCLLDGRPALLNIQTCRSSLTQPRIDRKQRKKQLLLPRLSIQTMFLLNLYTMPKQFSNTT